MIKIGILLTKQYKLLSLAAILDVFETANKLHTNFGKNQPYSIDLLAFDKNEDNTFRQYSIKLIHSELDYDLVIIPAFTTENLQEAISFNRQFIPWIQNQYSKGAEIATVCTGAFLLGASGLLNGKVATTHIDASDAFANAFPAVKLMANKTVTQDGRLFTSGGATSSFHLLLHLLKIHCGKDIAIKAAKIFAIDMDRNNQLYFGSFLPLRIHNDDLVASAQEKIETNYQDISTIEEMIKDIPSSRRNIVRRFKLVIGITPIAYLQRTRIEAAKKLLEQTAEQMSEVIFKSGYNDPKAFRKVFRKSVGMTPTEYRDKFRTR
ncbi:GlxA family transcriptional regulator [Pedobacter mucosus]|uniref:GlxA family transcriptional regulator n=1 Tax=Pedobacter mucosus TaxID=2895286 RepID=UPI001EE3BACD|nr:helix-turn-helix domain-containing protein [Pedobacter mucosus]UKT62191.1 helix-turn-helix domain-containing protein [Pedobacter mucosus]